MYAKLPLPNFYDPASAGQWDFRANARKLLIDAPDWRKQHAIKASTTDRHKVTLLAIDVQKDFCLPPVFDNDVQVGGGALYVGGRSGSGAIDDTRRTAEFIYRNLGTITHLRATQDTHFPFQIFSPAFWLTKDGEHVQPFTMITADELKDGVYVPNPAVAGFLCNGNLSWLQKQVIHYAEELEKAGRYALMIWPEHCLLGDEGHALVGAFQEARMFHAYVRGIQNETEIKGGNPLTENYSVLGPEVLTRHDGMAALAQKNARFIETLLGNDRVIILGQAASHCVAWTVDDLLTEINQKDASMMNKVYIVQDCMSAVAVPDGKGGFYQDFTDDVETSKARWADQGVHLVNSTDAIEDWPAFAA